MIMPRRPVLLDKAVDQFGIHVGCHVYADVVADDQQDVWTSRLARAGLSLLLCREHGRSSDQKRSQYDKSAPRYFDGSIDHSSIPPLRGYFQSAITVTFILFYRQFKPAAYKKNWPQSRKSFGIAAVEDLRMAGHSERVPQLGYRGSLIFRYHLQVC
jgi:hypothetical protein